MSDDERLVTQHFCDESHKALNRYMDSQLRMLTDQIAELGERVTSRLDAIDTKLDELHKSNSTKTTAIVSAVGGAILAIVAALVVRFATWKYGS